MTRDGCGLDHSGYGGSVEKWSDSESILEIELTGFRDVLGLTVQ